MNVILNDYPEPTDESGNIEANPTGDWVNNQPHGQQETVAPGAVVPGAVVPGTVAPGTFAPDADAKAGIGLESALVINTDSNMTASGNVDDTTGGGVTDNGGASVGAIGCAVTTSGGVTVTASDLLVTISGTQLGT
jgi:hypothetical protein